MDYQFESHYGEDDDIEDINLTVVRKLNNYFKDMKKEKKINYK